MLSTSVWTGNGGDGVFSNGANWQSGSAPASGDDIVFPDVGSPQQVDVDSAVTVGNIFVAGNYQLSDQPLTINGDVEAETNAQLAFFDTIAPSANNHFTSDAGASIVLSDLIDSPGNTYDEYGDGTLLLEGASSANWQVLAGTMLINDQSSINLTQYGGSVMSMLNGGGVGSFTQNGGTLYLTDTSVGYGASLESAGDINLNSGTLNIAVYGNFPVGRLIGDGNVTIGNAEQLQFYQGSSYVPAIGTQYVPVSETSGSDPVGSFSNLNIGNNLDASGTRFSTALHSNALTFTVLGQIPTLSLASSTTSATVGSPVTLTATLSGVNATPTGTVSFSDNGTALGSGTISNGVATLTVPSFAAGSHPITASYAGSSTFLSGVSSAVAITSTAVPTPTPMAGPTITMPVAGAVATATAATLSVAAADTSTSLTNGITYTWSLIRKPSGAKVPTFSVNGTHSAATTKASFSKDGTYHFRVIATDANGQSITSDVDYFVQQIATSLRLSPHAFQVRPGVRTTIKTVAVDQFGHAMRVTGTPTYTLNKGSGAISPSGVFTAGSVFGHVVIESSLDGLTGTVGATVV